MTELRRDDDHVYWLGEQRLIGVNEALNVLDGDRRWTGISAAMHLGTMVHLMLEFYDQGQLDEETLDPLLRSHLTQYQRATADHEIQWEGTETMLHHPAFLYAGTIDRFGIIDGKKTLVDFKTGKRVYPKTPLQLSAYQGLLSTDHGYYRRAALLLKEDSFEWVFYDAESDENDWNVFRACLTLAQWKGRNGR